MAPGGRFTREQIEQYRRAWLEIDTDRSGVVSVKEITAYMRRNNFDDSYLSHFLRTFDHDGSGRVTLREFCSETGLEFRTFYGSSSSGGSSHFSILAQEEFIRMWLECSRGSNRVAVTDFSDWCRSNSYGPGVVSKVISIFDENTDGYITLAEYARILGISIALFSGSSALRLPEGVRFVSGDMSLEWQVKIAELCLDAMRKEELMKKVPESVKRTADNLYERLWHCVIVNGQYWCYFGYQPGYSFVFQYGKYFFIVWKSPMS